MGILFANNVNMQLAGNLAANDTSFSVIAGQGSQCPEISTSSTDYMLLCFTDKDGRREIIKIIEHELDSDTFTIGSSTVVPHAASTGGRAYEATFDGYQSALAINAADSHKITMPVTAATWQEILVFLGSGVTSDDLAKLHAVTADESELNKMDGVTLTTAEINALINNVPPVGSIIAYSPGYFTDGSNGGFTFQDVSANSIAAANTLLNPKGWYVCNGAALNDADSAIFNGEGRYLPNLTDDRFFMGDTVAGGTGGANSNNIAHTHTVSAHTHTTGNFTLTTSHIPSHNHSITVDSGGNHRHTVNSEGGGSVQHNTLKPSNPGENTGYTGYAGDHTHTASCGNAGSGSAHNHGTTGSSGSGNTGSAGSSSLENRPQYLSCFYIMRVH